MTTVERIREICEELNVPISKLEKDLGFGNGYLNPKKIKDIKTDRFLKILEYLGISAEEFYESGSRQTREIENALEQIKNASPEVHADIMEKWRDYSPMIDKFKALDDHGKKVVNLVLNAEHERCVGKSVADLPEKKTKVIPLFPAAAGPGEPMDTTAIQEYEVDADSKAQFAVKISGDSMEPELHDGEIVLCKARRAQIGEFAVIMVNGFLLVKQYIEDGFGNFYLRSYNRDRKNLDYDHFNFSNDTVTGYGVVIHRKVPLVHE